MKPRTALALVLLSASALAQEAVAARRGTVRETAERRGTFVPAGAPELKLDLEVYRGELRLLEILPHGTFVNARDVVAKLDTSAADEQVQKETMGLERLEMDLRQLEERTTMQQEKDARAVASAERDLARAETRLRGFREHEKAHRDEDERLDIQRAQSRLDDQKDELAQLEKMYGEDELVDATEEIVLKRERRDFARSQAAFELGESRRAYRKEFFEPWYEEDLEEDAKQKTMALDQLRRSQAQAREREAADLAAKRAEVALQKRKVGSLVQDRAQLWVVHAPQAGLLLHGPADAAPWKRLEKDATLKNREVFLTVADPKRLRVVTDVPEKQVLAVQAGAAAEVVPDAMPERTLVGRLRADYLPQKEGLFRAEVPVDEAPVGLRPGMTAKVRIVIAEERDAVLVPNGALATKAEGTFVKAAKTAAGPFEERAVVAGTTDGKETAIREGVAEGEFVLVEKK